jgi:hypothetical protein
MSNRSIVGGVDGVGFAHGPAPASRMMVEAIVRYAPWREAEAYRAWDSGNLTDPGARELLTKLGALREPEIEIGGAAVEAARRAYAQAGARLRELEVAQSQRDRLVSLFLEAMFEEAEMWRKIDARRRQRG